MTSSSNGLVHRKLSNMKSESISHPATDVDTELGPTGNVPARKELKRDLKERHINMIAIAGMIVSDSWRKHRNDKFIFPTRGQASF